MHIYKEIHVLLLTLCYMFRRLLRHLQGELYLMLKIIVTLLINSFEHMINVSLKIAQ
jgi:hypothetical protein